MFKRSSRGPYRPLPGEPVNMLKKGTICVDKWVILILIGLFACLSTLYLMSQFHRIKISDRDESAQSFLGLSAAGSSEARGTYGKAWFEDAHVQAQTNDSERAGSSGGVESGEYIAEVILPDISDQAVQDEELPTQPKNNLTLVGGNVVKDSAEGLARSDLRALTHGQDRTFEEDMKPSLSVEERLLEQYGPIDLVYTWVNGSDAQFLSDKAFWSKDGQQSSQNGNAKSSSHLRGSAKIPKDSLSANRFRDNDELRFSLRSVNKFAPWVRHIYLVTRGDRPHWLNDSHPSISVIDHSAIFPDQEDLPTFNSAAIESCIHRIPGLSDSFIYMNDDFFFQKPVSLLDFMTEQGTMKFHLDIEISECAPRCTDNHIGDGVCNPGCMDERCDWDGGDCDSENGGEGLPRVNPKRRSDLNSHHASLVYSNRAMIRAFGRTDQYQQKEWQKLIGKHKRRRMGQHVPLLIHKSVMERVEQSMPEEVRTTRSHRFRDNNDLQFAFVYYNTLFHMYHEQGLEAFVPSESYLTFLMVNGGVSQVQQQLKNAKTENRTFLCINDDVKGDPTKVRRLIRDYFLEKFADPSPYEKP